MTDDGYARPMDAMRDEIAALRSEVDAQKELMRCAHEAWGVDRAELARFREKLDREKLAKVMREASEEWCIAENVGRQRIDQDDFIAGILIAYFGEG